MKNNVDGSIDLYWNVITFRGLMLSTKGQSVGIVSLTDTV